MSILFILVVELLVVLLLMMLALFQFPFLDLTKFRILVVGKFAKDGSGARKLLQCQLVRRILEGFFIEGS